jgi:molybdate transport system ATP-binding protein
MFSTILRIEDLHVGLYGQQILRSLSLEIQNGEHWAVFGEAGSGKTVLAHTIAGHHAFHGRVIFPEGYGENAVTVVDQQHRFRDLQNQSNFYYQQRYNAFDSEATITAAEDLAVFEESREGFPSKEELIKTFHLSSILDEPLIQLSNGENKRLQILKAVLSPGILMILDEPFTGLDREGRHLLDGILSRLTRMGRSLLLFSSRDHVPACFNRFAVLQEGRLVIKQTASEIRIAPAVKSASRNLPDAPDFDYPDFQYALRMRDVHVQYDGKRVLEGINWEVPRGTCWSLTGPNGAGKSTLLSLITADNPQAYANEIYLFDRKRGSGESIWDIKQKIGFLSPELQLYFDAGATAFSALASGLFDTIGLFRAISPLQEQCVMEWLSMLEFTAYRHRLLSSLPAGVQRLILLARAMIKAPPLLVLDEPCQGLDAAQTRFTLQLIDHYCRVRRAGLIYVSHYQEEFPDCLRFHLRLKEGRVV